MEQLQCRLAEYCQFLDDRNFREWSSLFSEDAVVTIKVGSNPPKKIEGRAAILKDILGGELADNPELRRKHAFLNPLIDVHGDTAQAIVDVLVFDQYRDEPFTIRLGKCIAHFVKRDGAWLFSSREYRSLPNAP